MARLSGTHGMQDYAAEFGNGGLNGRLDVDALVDACGLDAGEIRWRKEFIGFDETDEVASKRWRRCFATTPTR